MYNVIKTISNFITKTKGEICRLFKMMRLGCCEMYSNKSLISEKKKEKKISEYL